jgi:hypothetical protein
MKGNMKEEFFKGLNNRHEDPIQHGVYKLGELLGRMTSIKDELRKIREIQNGTSDRFDLTHCTYCDVDEWLNEIPRIVSYQLGNKVMSSIDSLKNVGFNDNQTSQIREAAVDPLLNLITNCESTHILTERRTFSWDSQNNYGYIASENLINQFLCFLDDLLTQCKKVSIGNPLNTNRKSYS